MMSMTAIAENIWSAVFIFFFQYVTAKEIVTPSIFSSYPFERPSRRRLNDDRTISAAASAWASVANHAIHIRFLRSYEIGIAAPTMMAVFLMFKSIFFFLTLWVWC
jgi:hypothetical protein